MVEGDVDDVDEDREISDRDWDTFELNNLHLTET